MSTGDDVRPAPIEIDWPEYQWQGMGCGLEDRGITDRYEACQYGFQEAVARCVEAIDHHGPLYTAADYEALLVEAIDWRDQLAAMRARAEAAEAKVELMDFETCAIRGELAGLKGLLSGFNVTTLDHPLQAPATYLTEIRIYREFQPGCAEPVVKAIRAALNEGGET